jgi:hypothetical protein
VRLGFALQHPPPNVSLSLLMASMEYPAFDSQLSDENLAQLGRMTVNFGYVELLLDWLLLAALNVRNADAIRLLITPLALKRKSEMLDAQLPKCPNEAAVVEIKKALPLIESASTQRNQIIHGYWALKNGVGMMAYYRKNPAQSKVTAPSVEDLADKAAIASRHLYAAYNLLNGSDPRRTGPDVLVPNDDGSFSAVVRPVESP